MLKVKTHEIHLYSRNRELRRLKSHFVTCIISMPLVMIQYKILSFHDKHDTKGKKLKAFNQIRREWAIMEYPDIIATVRRQNHWTRLIIYPAELSLIQATKRIKQRSGWYYTLSFNPKM